MSSKNTETFNFFVPVEAVVKADKDGNEERIIQGIASTEDRDLQDEVVLQNGLDYSYFLKYGYINSDHAKGPENIVGEPTECRITPKGLWVKAFLYKNKEKADYWWELLTALKTNPESKRKVGFSIEGKVQRRDGKKIVKAWLQNLAITTQPVNPHSWAEIAKSLNAQEWDDKPWEKSFDGPEGEDEDKALTTASGGALIPESLDRRRVVETFKSLNELTFDQAVMYCQLVEGFSQATAEAVCKSIFSKKGY